MEDSAGGNSMKFLGESMSWVVVSVDQCLAGRKRSRCERED